MPLPFADYKDGASASTPVETIKRKSDNEDEHDYLEMCAGDLMHAFKANDVKACAAALRAAFDLLDSEPHEEGQHTNA